VGALLSAGGVISATTVAAEPSGVWHVKQAVAPSGLGALQCGQSMAGAYGSARSEKAKCFLMGNQALWSSLCPKPLRPAVDNIVCRQWWGLRLSKALILFLPSTISGRAPISACQ